ncbi:MAG TPA: M23 family metallopeptidase [Nevskiaceae bacterium]
MSRWHVPHAEILHWTTRLPHGQNARSLRPGGCISACVGADGPQTRLETPQISTGPEASVASALDARIPAPVAQQAVPREARALPPPQHPLQRVDFSLHGSLDRALAGLRLPSTEINLIHAWLRADAHLPAPLPPATRVGLPLARSIRGPTRALALRVRYRGQVHELYSYTDHEGRRLALNRVGVGVVHLRLQTPVDFTRISSGWGRREQPVMPAPEFHKDLDYAAPAETRVRAAASGLVEFRGWHGNYERLVILHQHAPGTKTRYAHLSRIASGLHDGSRVRMGQVIGFVGSSGLSTGPHLYFELSEHGTRVDPLATPALNLPVRLSGPVLRAFSQYVVQIDRPRHPRVAAADGASLLL